MFGADPSRRQNLRPLTEKATTTHSVALPDDALGLYTLRAFVYRPDDPTTYLFLDDDVVSFRDAKHLWGQDAIQTEEKLIEEIGDENACAASIGPAGENLVRFSLGFADDWHNAGRFAGAVAGSKNLKAIVTLGSQGIKVFNPAQFRKTIIETWKNITRLYLMVGDLDRICFSFSRMRIYPNTRLYEIALKQEVIDKQDNLLSPTFYKKPGGLEYDKIFVGLYEYLAKIRKNLFPRDFNPLKEKKAPAGG